MEAGNWDEANRVKEEVEERQRTARKQREAEAEQAMHKGEFFILSASWLATGIGGTCSCLKVSLVPSTSRYGSRKAKTKQPAAFIMFTRTNIGAPKRIRIGDAVHRYSNLQMQKPNVAQLLFRFFLSQLTANSFFFKFSHIRYARTHRPKLALCRFLISLFSSNNVHFDFSLLLLI